MAEESMTGKAIARARDHTCLIRPIRDRFHIQRLLEPQRVYAAYALAQLEPPLFAKSQWWLAEAGENSALLMHSKGGLGNALVALGDADSLHALLSLHPGPSRAFAVFQVEHLAVMRRFYVLLHDQPMIRMEVTSDSFTPAPEETNEAAHVRRLSGGGDARDINRLQSSEGGRAHYRASDIEDGVYFGAYYDGRLAAAAGTHAISPSNGIAVVGNVFTHPLYRNRHFALQVTSAVTEILLKTCPQVVLTVDPKNATALRTYSRLGYREVCQLIEGGVARREILGLGSLLRRLLARWRCRSYGRELLAPPESAWTANPTCKESTQEHD